MNIANEEKKDTLLFVDDEENILRSMKRLFIPLGYEVLIASSGADALLLLNESDDIDVIISDMRMPEMDGAAFLKEAARHWPHQKRLLLTGYADIESAISAINDGKIDHYLKKPCEENELEDCIDKVLEAKRLKEKNKALEQELRVKNKELHALNEGLEEKIEKKTQQIKMTCDTLQKTYQSTIQVLASLVELHEGEHKGHCRKIAAMAKKTSEKLGLCGEEIQDIYLASLLHNIGKMGMPDALIKQPVSSFSQTEKQSYIQYPLLGEAALMAFEPLKNVAGLIANHKEYLDGSGYPMGLAEESIPRNANIITVAVDYAELQLGILEGTALPASQALQVIQSNKNKRYREDVVDAFAKVIAESPVEQERLQELLLAAEDLREGMELSRDLIANSGIMLLSQGQILNKTQVDNIKKLKSLTVYIKA